MNPLADDFVPPEEPQIEHHLPRCVRKRLAAYDFREFLAADGFDPSFTATDSDSVMRQAIADVSLNVG